ncbi:SCO1/SenC-domain-containing protein [Dipodascopsis uninucleata]
MSLKPVLDKILRVTSLRNEISLLHCLTLLRPTGCVRKNISPIGISSTSGTWKSNKYYNRSFSTYRSLRNEKKTTEDNESQVVSKVRPMAEENQPSDDSIVIEVKDKNRNIPFKIAGGVLFLLLTALLVNYRRRVQRAAEAYREEKESQSFGKALIGGPFQLVDQHGNLFTDEDLKGKFSLVYFGFTLCPDICPDELDKLAVIVRNLKKDGIDVQPIFITCDPARDSPEVMKQYLQEFDFDHIVGLTGTWEEVKACCKAYRVYFSTPPDVKPGQDYIVDHSIFFYLMDPEGEFVNVYGRRYDANEATMEISKKIKNWLPAKERRDVAFKKPSFWKFWE